MKKQNILMIVTILFVGACIVGGTYAYLSQTANVTNASYNVDTHCFLVDYNINNVDGSQDITGTLFPSATPDKGLSGRVGMKISSSCSLNGVGTLKLHINGNNATNSKLTTSATSYCEDRSTLEPMTGNDAPSTKAECNTAGGRWQGYSDSYCESNTTLERLTQYDESNCTSNGGTWTSGGSPLKYAVYGNAAGTGAPLAAGHITANDIGTDKTIYDNFGITGNQEYYYIYIWLDGYLTDSTYVDLPFSGNISASATQSNNNTYTVTFKYNDGVTSDTTKTVLAGTNYGDLPTPTRAGYTFKGWNGKNMIGEISSSEYTIYTYYGRVSSEFLNAESYSYIRIHGYQSSDRIDTAFCIRYNKVFNSLEPGDYYLSFDIRSENSILNQCISNSNFEGYSTGFISNPFNKDLPKYLLNGSLNFSNDGQWNHVSGKIHINGSENINGYSIQVGSDSPDLYGIGSYLDIANIQLEKNTIATPYEPYYVTSDVIVTQDKNHTLYAIWEPNS